MIRLLRFDHCGKLCLQEFGNGSVPAYAILSHTWCRPSDQELSFHDVRDNVGHGKPGYEKAIFCLKKAAEYGIEYCWVDTCCIDKTSSAELSRAINSMFRWYRDASRCFVYLTDVSTAHSSDGSTGSYTAWEQAFRQSRWFTRGWTLQELLAPPEVGFFSKEETYLGNRTSLEEIILSVTHLPSEVLRGKSLSSFALDQRKSWAKSRQTSEPEDQVYCLLGILGISMSAIYGEGVDRARDRLDTKIQHSVELSTSSVPGKRIGAGIDDEDDNQPVAKKPRQLEEPSLNAESQVILIESLRFDQMDARQLSVKKAHAKTCKWLLKHPQYLQWLDDTKFDFHHGFLWIKGKPGSGKSTLMKLALANAWKTKRSKGTVVLSFFFNARGETMEKSTTGAYRTLLVQLFEQLPNLRIDLGDFGLTASRISEEYLWDVELLKELLLGCFQRLGAQQVMCFVDALDECGEKEVRDMISFFESIGDHGVSISGQIRICLASRYYPHITIQHGLDLALDGTEGHKEDIEAYLASELKIGRGDVAEQVRGELLGRASGVFIWIVLVVDILNKEFDSGQIQGLLRRLDEIPDSLHRLFEDILMRDASNRELMLLCIQWILFAEKPLAPDQLYFAIRSGMEATVIPRPEPEQIANDIVQRYILNASKGLAETTKTSARKSATVQFIHESVRDFLIKENGLVTMWSQLGPDVEHSCHSRLKQCCQLYLDADLSEFASQLDEPANANDEAARALSSAIKEKFPFLEYAVKNLLYHMNKGTGEADAEATAHDLSPDAFKNWKRVSNAIAKHQTHRYGSAWTLLDVACHRDYRSLVQIEVKKLASDHDHQPYLIRALSAALGRDLADVLEILLQNGVRIQLSDKIRSLYRPFQQAIEKRRQRSIDILLEMGLEMRLKTDKGVLTRKGVAGWVPAAAGEGNQRLLRLLLDCGLNSNATNAGALESGLLRAAESGHHDCVQLLIDAGADVNLQIAFRDTALRAAAESGHHDCVQLLIDAGADVNLQTASGKTALTAAVRYGYVEVVQRLIDAGADVNLQIASGETALIAAARYGYIEVVQRLIDAGADVNLQTASGNTALEQAAGRGHAKCAQLLLGAGAETDITSVEYAANCGSLEVMQLLLDHGAPVNDPEHGRDIPIITAATYGNLKIVQLLIEHEADVNAWDHSGAGALEAAIGRGHSEVVQLLTKHGGKLRPDALHRTAARQSWLAVERLLEHGLDINDRNVSSETPLHCVISGDYPDFKIVQLLLQRGADANAVDADGHSALSRAAACWRPDIVEALLRHGVHVNTPDSSGMTALDHAIRRRTQLTDSFFAERSDEVIKLLREFGAQGSST